MDGHQTGNSDRILNGLASATEAVLGLPAVPTLDWCDRAASAVARLIEPAIAVVTIGTLSEAGELVGNEVSGVGVRYQSNGSGRVRALRRDEIGIRGEDGRVGSLRVRAARLRKLGIRLSAEQRGEIVAGVARTLPGGEAVVSGDLSTLWENLDAGTPLIAIASIGQADSGRVMIVQVAPLDPDAVVSPDSIRALTALMPALRRRTLLALGEERAEETRWLTVREQLVLEHLSLGKSVRQIAVDLGRSPHTVHDHVKSLHRKLNASSRGELIARALGHVGTAAPQAQQTEIKPAPKQTGVPTSGSIEPKPSVDRVTTDS